MIERGGKRGKRKEKRNLTQQTGQDPSDRFSSLGGSWLVLAANLGEDDLGEFVRMPPHEFVPRLQPRGLSLPACVRLVAERVHEELLDVLG